MEQQHLWGCLGLQVPDSEARHQCWHLALPPSFLWSTFIFSLFFLISWMFWLARLQPLLLWHEIFALIISELWPPDIIGLTGIGLYTDYCSFQFGVGSCWHLQFVIIQVIFWMNKHFYSVFLLSVCVCLCVFNQVKLLISGATVGISLVMLFSQFQSISKRWILCASTKVHFPAECFLYLEQVLFSVSNMLWLTLAFTYSIYNVSIWCS